MNLYIEIENGVTKNHPAFEDNIRQAFGSIPAHWLESQEPVYTKVNGVWTDVWHKRDLTVEEKTAKQQAIITAFNDREYASNWSAWTLDEATCEMVPPIPRPAPVEGVAVLWCGADNNWKEVPVRPEGEYKFDFLAWQWVAL